MNDKLYVLVRADMTPGYQAVQAMHAAVNMCMRELWEPAYDEKSLWYWWFYSNTIVVLSVEGEDELLWYAAEAEARGIKAELFWEPDVLKHTAVALWPGEASAELTQDLKLALSEKKWWRFWK